MFLKNVLTLMMVASYAWGLIIMKPQIYIFPGNDECTSGAFLPAFVTLLIVSTIIVGMLLFVMLKLVCGGILSAKPHDPHHDIAEALVEDGV